MQSTSKKKKQPGHARVAKVATVKVKIIAENGLGQYKKGETIERHKTTAQGLVDSEIAEKVGKW